MLNELLELLQAQKGLQITINYSDYDFGEMWMGYVFGTGNEFDEFLD